MNYVEQFMKDNGLVVGQRFNITNSNLDHTFSNDKYYLDDIRGHLLLHKENDVATYAQYLCYLLRGEWKVKHLPWKPKQNETYYFIFGDGQVSSTRFHLKTGPDLYRYQHKNCFPTYEQAQLFSADVISEFDKIRSELNEC